MHSILIRTEEEKPRTVRNHMNLGNITIKVWLTRVCMVFDAEISENWEKGEKINMLENSSKATEIGNGKNERKLMIWILALSIKTRIKTVQKVNGTDGCTCQEQILQQRLCDHLWSNLCILLFALDRRNWLLLDDLWWYWKNIVYEEAMCSELTIER